MSRSASLAMAVVLFVGAPVACRGSSRPTALPRPPTEVAVGLSEYAFVHEPTVPAGRALFRPYNRGQANHEVLLIRLPEGLTGTIQDQLRSSTRRPVETVEVVAGLRPGESAVFAVDLLPGRYGFVCFVDDPDGTSHASKGMTSELTVE